MYRSVAGRVWLVIICAAGLTACEDVGLYDRNLPIDQARERQFGYRVYQPTANSPAVAMAGRHWLRAAPIQDIPAHMLTQVGNAEGTVLYALRGQQAPYSTLYSPVSQDRWATYLRLN